MRVDELEPAIEKVVAAGSTLIAIREPGPEPHTPVRLAELKDTEGNLFEFPGSGLVVAIW